MARRTRGDRCERKRRRQVPQDLVNLLTINLCDRLRHSDMRPVSSQLVVHKPSARPPCLRGSVVNAFLTTGRSGKFVTSVFFQKDHAWPKGRLLPD